MQAMPSSEPEPPSPSYLEWLVAARPAPTDGARLKVLCLIFHFPHVRVKL